MGDLKDNKPQIDRMSHVSAEVLFRIHKDLSEVNNKGANNPVLKWAKDLTSTAPERGCGGCRGCRGRRGRRGQVMGRNSSFIIKPKHMKTPGTAAAPARTANVQTHMQQKPHSAIAGETTHGVRLCERA